MVVGIFVGVIKVVHWWQDHYEDRAPQVVVMPAMPQQVEVRYVQAPSAPVQVQFVPPPGHAPAPANAAAPDDASPAPAGPHALRRFGGANDLLRPAGVTAGMHERVSGAVRRLASTENHSRRRAGSRPRGRKA